MDIKNNYPVNYCDIKIKDEPEEEEETREETTESNDFRKTRIKTEYKSENEDELDSDADNLVIKQELEEKSEDNSISNKEIKLEDIPFSIQKFEAINHNIEDISQCDICSFTTTDKTYLPIHKKIHRKKQCCDMCLYICGSVAKLKHHKRKKHMKDKDLRIYCKDCSFSTLVRRHLTVHRRENHKKAFLNTRISAIKCLYCSYRGKASNMEKHTDQFHEGTLVSFV